MLVAKEFNWVLVDTEIEPKDNYQALTGGGTLRRTRPLWLKKVVNNDVITYRESTDIGSYRCRSTVMLRPNAVDIPIELLTIRDGSSFGFSFSRIIHSQIERRLWRRVPTHTKLAQPILDEETLVTGLELG